MRPLLLAFTWIFLTACGPGAGDSSTLRVGTSGDYAPLTFVEDGQLRGVEIDFANGLANEMGKKLEIVQLPFVELIPALLDRRIDVIMSGMSATAERMRQVAFADPYMQVGQMALIRAAEFDARSKRDQVDLPETRIGFRPGTTGEDFVRSRIREAQLVPIQSIEEGIQALRDKRIDYFVHDAPTIWRIVGGLMSTETELTGMYRPLTEEYLAWALRKDDRELMEQLDSTLNTWRADGRLELTLDTWIPVRKVQVE